MLFTIPLAFAMHQLTDNAVVAHDHNGSNIYEVVEDLQSMPEFGSGLPCFLYVSMQSLAAVSCLGYHFSHGIVIEVVFRHA